jgi:ketosteroid isomerase-like protein
MPSFLSDPPVVLYGLLVLVAVVPLLAALFFPENRTAARGLEKKPPSRRKWFLLVAGIGFLLLAGLALSDYFFESDREQIKRKLNEMSEGVRNHDMNRVFINVSESFRVQSADKAALRKVADAGQQSGQVTEIKLSNIEVQPIESGARNATAEFQVKIEGPQQLFFRCRAVFVKDPDGQWRLQSFQVFNPAADMNQPIPVPGM